MCGPSLKGLPAGKGAGILHILLGLGRGGADSSCCSGQAEGLVTVTRVRPPWVLPTISPHGASPLIWRFPCSGLAEIEQGVSPAQEAAHHYPHTRGPRRAWEQSLSATRPPRPGPWSPETHVSLGRGNTGCVRVRVQVWMCVCACFAHLFRNFAVRAWSSV